MKQILHIYFAFLFFIIISCNKEKPLEITITNPKDGQEFALEDNIQINVIATGSENAIASVHLYIDDEGYSGVSEYPYIFTINAGTLPLGKHTIKVIAKNYEGKQTESSIVVSIVDLYSESPDFVTFTNGIIPKGWEVDGWYVDSNGGLGGYDDIFSLYTKILNATTTATKTCNYIQFYLSGEGMINFYIDNELSDEIVLERGDPPFIYHPLWRIFNYYVPEGLHTFKWELQRSSYSRLEFANLDAITFSTN